MKSNETNCYCLMMVVARELMQAFRKNTLFFLIIMLNRQMVAQLDFFEVMMIFISEENDWVFE